MKRLSDYLDGADDELVELVPAGPSVPRLTRVRAERGTSLVLTWKDGKVTRVDLTGLVARHQLFADLSDPAVFAGVAMIENGHGVGWGDDLDLSAETLRSLAEAQAGWTGKDFTRWMERLKLSNATAADVLDVHINTIKRLKTADNLDRLTTVTAQAIEEHPHMLDAFFRPRAAGRPKRADNS
jgi:hypothetical protein